MINAASHRTRTALIAGSLLLVAGLLAQPGQPAAAQPGQSQPGPRAPIAEQAQPNHRYHANQRHRGKSANRESADRKLMRAQGKALHSSGSDRSPVPGAEAVVFDPATQTVYAPSETSASVAVIDARTCNAKKTTCRAPIATIAVDDEPFGVVIDAAHRTLYVASYGPGTVSVIDLRNCHARRTTGCSAKPKIIPVEGNPAGLALNAKTHSLYVGNEGGPVAVVDTATCNGAKATGCAAPVATLAAGDIPLFPYVDPATNTLYVPKPAEDGADGLQVFDVSRCRAGATSGCTRAPVAVAPTEAFPLFVLIDRQTKTLFVSNNEANSLSLIDYRRCNAKDTTGCAGNHPTAVTPPFPQNLAIDEHTRTLYVMSDQDLVTAINLRTCSSTKTTSCQQHPRTLQTGAKPWWMDFDPATGTLYLANRADGDVQAINARRCSATTTAGCRQEVPTAPGAITELDPVRHTGYQLFGPGTAGVLNTTRCNASQLAGCKSVPTFPAGQALGPASMDTATHTLYIVDLGTDFESRRVLVFDTATCNAKHPAGCVPIASIPVPGASISAVNPVTHTVYVTMTNEGKVAVIDGKRCNALDRSRCDVDPTMVTTGGTPFVPWVDPGSNTVYITDPFSGDDGVLLLNGAGCDGGAPDCGVVAKTPVGPVPIGLTIDAKRHTLYVANNGFGDVPGTVGMIDISRCNAGNTTGCQTTWPSTPAGHGVFGVRYDQGSHTVFTSNIDSATVSLIDTSRCNARRQDGCQQRPPRIAVGYFPVASYSDPSLHTMYVTNDGSRGTSIIDTRNPCRTHVCFR